MSDEKDPGQAVLRVAFDVTGVEAQYASNLVVQHDEHDFTISFFDIRPPLLVGSPDEKKNQLAATGGEVKARCVGRLILTPSRMEEFVKVMQTNLQKFKLQRAGEEASKETVQ